MSRLIAFAGRKFSGKNEAANAVLAAYPFSSDLFAFASKLKAIAQDVYGLTFAQTDGDQKETVDPRWDLTPREIMQRLGAEVVRSVHIDTWVRFLLDGTIPAAEVEVAVITDCRFDNEAKAIRSRGGIVIRIVRPGLPRGPFSDHPSETGIDALEVDHEIVNDGTIEDLHRKVLGVIA